MLQSDPDLITGADRISRRCHSPDARSTTKRYYRRRTRKPQDHSRVGHDPSTISGRAEPARRTSKLFGRRRGRFAKTRANSGRFQRLALAAMPGWLAWATSTGFTRSRCPSGHPVLAAVLRESSATRPTDDRLTSRGIDTSRAWPPSRAAHYQAVTRTLSCKNSGAKSAPFGHTRV